MEKDDSATPRRKVRFAPKAPSRRKPKSVALKTEVGDEDDEGVAEAQTLLRQFNEKLTRRGPKAEKKTQVAFGPGATTSSSMIRSYGAPKNGDDSKSSNVDIKSSDDDQILSTLPSKKYDTNASFEDATDASTRIGKKEYRELWEYQHTYYPTILPLRRPYSGDPEILNAADFGEAAINKEYSDNATNPAQVLGLTEENEENMFLFQFPPILPLVKRSASAKGKEKVGSSTSGPGVSTKGGKLEDLSAGYVGKMLVYKSGAVKLKLGDVLYDVSPGVDRIFAEDVVSINTAEKQCCVVGELNKHAVVNPDIHSLVNSVIDLG